MKCLFITIQKSNSKPFVMKKTIFYPGILFLFFLIFTACPEQDDMPPEDETNGSFSFSITGDENFTLAGEAGFMHVMLASGDMEASATSLSITLTDPEGDNSVVVTLTKKGAKLFQQGTYLFNEEPGDDDIILSMAFFSNATSTTYVMMEGNLKLSNVKNNLLEGSIAAELTNFDGKNVLIGGNFKAVGITQTY
jgi:hypothetical protein